ncbi:MAG: hypothetical protein ACK5Q5_12695 [Planctomycetaceae bacterium]
MQITSDQAQRVSELVRKVVTSMSRRSRSIKDEVAQDVTSVVIVRLLQLPAIVNLDHYVRRTARLESLKQFRRRDRIASFERQIAQERSDRYFARDDVEFTELSFQLDQEIEHLPRQLRLAVLAYRNRRSQRKPSPTCELGLMVLKSRLSSRGIL